MQLLDGPVYSRARSLDDTQSSKCPTLLIRGLTSPKSKSLLQITVLSEPQWVQLRSVDQFALVLDTVKFVVFHVSLDGSSFLVD
jgi:hypothetical protein